jgi:hypothetical protein
MIALEGLSSEQGWAAVPVPWAAAIITFVCGLPVLAWCYAKVDVWLRNHPSLRDPRAPLFCSYSIPFLGNGLEFGTDMAGFIQRNRRVMDGAPLFSCLVNGKIMHIVTVQAVIPQIYRSGQQLTFRPTLAEFVGIGFGVSNQSLDKLFLGEKNQFQEFKTMLVQQLTTSVQLDRITSDAQQVLRDTIHSSYTNQEWKTVDLMDMVSDLVFRASISLSLPVLQS